jgi:hypothetical protein
MTSTNCNTFGTLLDTSNDVRIYTCDDFKGNIEIYKGKYMFLFYTKNLIGADEMLLEHPIDVFDMDIENPTPSENYIPLDSSEDITSVLKKMQTY